MPNPVAPRTALAAPPDLPCSGPRTPGAPPTAPDPARDALLAEACRNAEPANDEILYVGMNEASARREASALRGARVVTSSATSTVRAGGATHDLSAPAGCAAFAATLGLDAGAASAVAHAIASGATSGRDELARIALVWAAAARGEAVPSRLVISGHSTGDVVWGRTSQLDVESVIALARAMPAAARQIEDVHLSACFTEAQLGAIERWTEAFPALKTLWAYRGFAPAAPVDHLAAWEAATRGRATSLDERLVARHGSATTWSLSGGVANAALGISERRARAAAAETRLAGYLAGAIEIPDAHDPRAERDYTALRMLAASPLAAADERARARDSADRLVRVRFWNQNVRHELARAYGARIDQALAEAGLARVDLSRASRRDAVALIEAYRAVGRDPAMLRLLDDIDRLDPAVVPARWCR